MHVVFIPKNEFNEDGLLLDSFVFGERERVSILTQITQREREKNTHHLCHCPRNRN